MVFCSALYERRFGRFPAVIDRRYRAAFIFPRCLFAERPEEVGSAARKKNGHESEESIIPCAKKPGALGTRISPTLQIA
jgi:hypothetical protein